MPRLALALVLALIVAVPLVALLTGDDDGPPGPPAPVDAAALDAWIAAEVPSSPLAGRARAFVRAGVANDIDPRALLAIAWHESVLGTAGSGRDIHNAFGWGPAIPFGSWEENVAVVARGLRTGYLDDGRTTLVRIAARWAPVGAPNDPQGLNTSWVGAVRAGYASLGGDPDRAITLTAQARAAGGPTRGADGLATPTGGAGTMGGGPGEGTHAAGEGPDDWQSDRAVDVRLPFGSPVWAVDAGRVVRIGGDAEATAGRFGGARLTLLTDDDAYFYGHLAAVMVRPGQRVERGALLGFSGAANGVDHLHLGVRRRDPVAVAGLAS